MKRPFELKYLPVNFSNESIIKFYKLEIDATAKIERFNTMLERSMIREDILMYFSLDESIQSTRIEGTQTTFDEVFESDITGEINNDIIEVKNYYKALQRGESLLKSYPLSTRIFLELHRILLDDSRGRNRNPGEYRKIQNFIGPTNDIKDASFIPPEPQMISSLMSNLEKYINDDLDNLDDLGILARTAVIHAQFESIHPFLDGNGRLGRILIILNMIDKGLLKKSTFFMSQELEKNKYKYYALLNNLRKEKPNWDEWILFFINSATNQAEYYIEKLERIEYLYNDLIIFSQQNNIKKDFIDVIFRNPVFTVKKLSEIANISYNTSNKYIKMLTDSGKVFGDDKSRNRIFRFYDLIDILR